MDLISNGVSFTSNDVGLEEPVHLYEAVNKSDEKETKLLACGTFVTYIRENSDQVSTINVPPCRVIIFITLDWILDGLCED